jgi:hypothetical protein
MTIASSNPGGTIIACIPRALTSGRERSSNGTNKTILRSKFDTLNFGKNCRISGGSSASSWLKAGLARPPCTRGPGSSRV